MAAIVARPRELSTGIMRRGVAIFGTRGSNQNFCDRATFLVHTRLVYLQSSHQWILEEDMECVIVGEARYRITLQLTEGPLSTYIIHIFFSIEREGNRGNDHVNDPGFSKMVRVYEPTVCEMHLVDPSGRVCRNSALGYLDGIMFFNGTLDDIAFDIVTEVYRLHNIAQLQCDDPPGDHVVDHVA
jgi:hypothetical protein